MFAIIYSDITELIGSTPLLRLNNYGKLHGLDCEIIVKLESKNPAGSAKDRVALRIIESAEEKGLLKAGGTVIEATSGNTGIGLACVCAPRGYRCIIVMPDSMSPERIKLMKAYGAEVVLTPGADGMTGAVNKAEELKASIPGSFIADQFNNPDNVSAHYMTTGPEIVKDTDGKVDIFVAGVGTGGTVTGTGKYLKEHVPGIKIVGFEPSDSPLLTEGRAGSHALQGIGANFVPSILDTSVMDEILTVSTEEAFAAARELASCEGFLVGITSGAAVSAALKLAQRGNNRGKRIVVLLPDSGERYLSTDLFTR